uniref:Uncharacterized protein n=1 Tax=Rhizophora mucronata TaxID=61149 RepID=A0A2P2PMD3_RHIMU
MKESTAEDVGVTRNENNTRETRAGMVADMVRDFRNVCMRACERDEEDD